MIVLKSLTVIDIEDGKPATYSVGNCGLLTINFVGNSTHRLTYSDKKFCS